jgi:uncharacterized integral membrane protein
LYRLGLIIAAVLALALGLLVGTLNSAPVAVDLLWVQFDWPLGLVILAALAIGLLIGLILAWLFGILPARARLRRAAAPDARGRGGALTGNHD